MKIGILGCGPSGLIAAYVAEELGHEVRIVSKKRRSYIAGAQYLHNPLEPSEPDDMIEVRKRGTREGYAEKVYGYPDAPVSWDNYSVGEYPAWNMRKIYDELWERYETRVSDVTLDARTMVELVYDNEVDLIVNTVPLPAICRRNGRGRMEIGEEHQFMSQTVHILQKEDAYEHELSFIEYNGDKAPAYYRRSIIFGTEAVEWSGQQEKPPIEDVVTIQKPVATNCDCWTESRVVMLAGRYGSWNKWGLTHHVANDVENRITSLERV